MFADERQRVILDLVQANGAMAITDLASMVKTSPVTVRRDLRVLEQKGLLDRRHGGAVSLDRSTYEPSYSEKSHVAASEKAAIGDLAASLVQDGDVIAIGAGSTTQALARRIARRRELTVMTNSLLVAQVLARSQGIDVVMTGGNLRGSIFALVGTGAEQSLANMRTRRVFLSGNGLSPERGLSTPSPLVAGVDRAIVATAQEVVVLADHTKLGVEAMVQTVAVERITHLVTNDQAPADLVSRFRDRGVIVHVAGTEREHEGDDRN